jgi:hypothetical protein
MIYPRFFPEDTTKYVRKNKYPYMQISLLPPLLYQTRFKQMECPKESYAHNYIQQPASPHLAYFGMNAPRDSDLLVCVDRDSRQDVYFDPIIETDGVTFNNEVVYAKFIMDGLDPLSSLIRKQWVDTQTNEVILSSMVYTQDLEVYTVVRVTFTISSAGRITAVPEFSSIVDLFDSGKFNVFETYYYIAMPSAVIALLIFLWAFKKKDPEARSLIGLLEFTSTVTILSLLYYINYQIPLRVKMSDQFNTLLDVFLSIPDLSASALHNLSQKCFTINTVVFDELDWMMTMRILAFLIVLVQFVQLNVYMRVHPRIAVLARTLNFAFDDTFHFLILFCMIFGILAFVSWWSFGATIPEFSTFGEACSRQFEMLVGEYPWDSLAGLPDNVWYMYVVYLIMYTILAFFILVNFFLAIVVESFMQVKEQIENQVTENASPYDTMDIFLKIPLYLVYGWPRRGKIIASLKEEGDLDHLQRLVEDNKDKVDAEIEYQGTVDATSLVRNFPSGFTLKSAETFLKVYRRTVPDLEFEKFEQDNQRIMLEDLKDTMNKRKSILEEMRAPEEAMEAKAKANDIGALQHSISLLDQEIGMRQKELEMKTNDLRVKQKHIRDLKRRLNKMGVDHPGNGHGNGNHDDDSTQISSHSDPQREVTGLSSEIGANGTNGKNGKNGNGSSTAEGSGSQNGSNGSH